MRAKQSHHLNCLLIKLRLAETNPVDTVFQVKHFSSNRDAKAFAHIELGGLLDLTLGEFDVDTPIARLVGIGQRRTLGLLPLAHVVELGRLRRKTGLDVAQTLTVWQVAQRASRGRGRRRCGATKVYGQFLGLDTTR